MYQHSEIHSNSPGRTISTCSVISVGDERCLHLFSSSPRVSCRPFSSCVDIGRTTDLSLRQRSTQVRYLSALVDDRQPYSTGTDTRLHRPESLGDHSILGRYVAQASVSTVLGTLSNHFIDVRRSAVHLHAHHRHTGDGDLVDMLLSMLHAK